MDTDWSDALDPGERVVVVHDDDLGTLAAIVDRDGLILELAAY